MFLYRKSLHLIIVTALLINLFEGIHPSLQAGAVNIEDSLQTGPLNIEAFMEHLHGGDAGQITPQEEEENKKIITAISNKNYKDIPVEVIDPYHLTGQRVHSIKDGKIYKLDSLTINVPPEALDSKLKVSSKDGVLIFSGTKYGKAVYEHHIEGFNLIAQVEDDLLFIFLDKNGSIYSIDKVHLSKTLFQEIIPVYKIYEGNQESSFDFDGNKQYRLEFMTRGLKDFALSEVVSSEEKPLVAKDKDNNPLLSAGDLVITEISDENRQLRAILNRQVIEKIMMVGTIQLTLSAMLASHEGYGTTLPEWMERLLGIHVKTKESYSETLMKYMKKYDIEEKSLMDPRDGKDSKDALSSQDIIYHTLKTYDRKKIIVLMERLLKMDQLNDQDERNVDKYTLSTWKQSYQKIVEEGKIEEQSIEKELLSGSGSSMNKEHLKEYLDILKKTAAEKNYHPIYKYLLEKSLLSRFEKSSLRDRSMPEELLKKNFVSKIFSKRGLVKGQLKGGIAILAMSLTSVLAIKEGLVPDGMMENYNVLAGRTSTQFSILSNWVLDKVTNVQKIFEYPGYLWPGLVLGVLILGPLLVTLIGLFGKYQTEMMYALEQVSKKVGMDDLAHSLKVFRKRLDHKDFTQKLSAAMTFFFGTLNFPIWNKILNLAKQPMLISSLIHEINPLKKINDHSSSRVGFNNPLASASKNKNIYKAQEEKIEEFIEEKIKTKNLSFKLAALTVASERNIHPGVLAGLMDKSLSVKTMKKIFADPLLEKKFEYIAQNLFHTLSKSSKQSEEIDIVQLEKFYKLANEYADDIDQNKYLKSFILKLNNSFSRSLYAFVKAFIKPHGKNDAILKGKILNENMTQQTFREFLIDHATVLTIPIVIGEYADPTKPEQLAYRDDPSTLYVNPQLLASTMQNVYGHLILGQSTKLLAYISDSENKHMNIYDDSELYHLKINDRKESYSRTTMLWLREILNFKESNVGSYFTEHMKAKFATLQAACLTALVLRVLFGQQDISMAILGGFYFMLYGLVAYSWPWILLSVGEGTLTKHFQKKVAKFKEVLVKVIKGSQSNNDKELLQAYKELSQYYTKESSRIDLQVDALVDKEPILFAKYQKQIMDALYNTNKTPLVLGTIVSSQMAIMQKDRKALHTILDDLKDILNTDFTDKQIEERLELNKGELKRFAHLLTNSAMINPAISTEANIKSKRHLTIIVTIITTVMALSLTVDSYDLNKMDFGNAFESLGLFLLITYLMASTRSASWYVDLYHKILAQLKTILSKKNKGSLKTLKKLSNKTSNSKVILKDTCFKMIRYINGMM